MHLIVFPILIFFITYLLIGISLKYKIITINDEPNERSLHNSITPRYGGLIFISVSLLTGFLIFPEHIQYLIILCLLLMSISFIDDIGHVNFVIRLIIHFLIAFSLIFIQPGEYNFFIYSLLVLYLVWSINLTNFIDGANGLAGGCSFISFLIYGIAFYLSGNDDFFLFSLIISSSIFAFLIYNFDDAKIFMGDTGAATLGFLLAAFGFYGWSQDYWFFWFPLLVSAPAISDTTLTLLKRIFHGHKFWEPHQNHLFQKLILMGNGHRKISIIYIYLTFIFGSVGIITNFFASNILMGILLIPLGLFLIFSIFLIERRWALFDKSINRAFHFVSFNDLSLRYHNFLVIFLDLLLVILAWHLSYVVRFSLDFYDNEVFSPYNGLLTIILIQSFCFYIFSIHKSSWRYVSISDFSNILYSVATSSLLIIIFYLISSKLNLLTLFQFDNVPRSIFLLDFIFVLTLISGSRILFRVIYENFNQPLAEKNIIILGVSEESVTISKQLLNNDKWNLIGFLDDDKYKNREIHGLKVLGSINELKQIHNIFNINHIILPNHISGSPELRNVYRICHALNIQVMTMPLLNDILDESNYISTNKKINIEDLLGREKVTMSSIKLPTLFDEKIVFITGAGGSIGSELSIQIASLEPKLLICFDISEAAIYNLQQLNPLLDKKNIIFLVGDIKDEARISSIFSKYNPNIILHAAAYKHVPMMESKNIYEALINNSYGTYLLSKQAKRHNVNKFIFISTDKAINPTNIMGASKRLAEIYCQSLNSLKSTKFITVRFGNVLGSSGSVIHLFKKQIEHGGPITITHPDITRYFMSVSEATRLVLEAADIGDGGEIFVLDMGVPIKISDLAKDMIALYGLSEESIEIKYIGLRPGEKLFEELLADDELTKPTLNKKIRVARMPRGFKSKISESLRWIKNIHNESESKIKKDLKMWVKEYRQK
tara:strand:+ start:8517 stop:11351 length:2835 start_codon:yes stop_codon:yes gene_type:complete